MVNIEEAQKWQKLADMDLKTAEYLKNMKPLPIEIICYHCQQSAEKYLKGYLVFCGTAPPKMHDLDELCKLNFTFLQCLQSFSVSAVHHCCFFQGETEDHIYSYTQC
ncbi:MAG: HEPN domain-containing protein [Actinobacteria bacterium]|nr:HEPN domain-containing protein [Actinomycetota bacterium]